MDALRRILGQLLLRPTSRTSFSNVQQTLPYIPYSRFAYMYEIHQDLEQTHPIPSLRNIPSSAFFRIHQGVSNYVKHTFNVVHFAPVNHLSISKDPQYEKVTRFSSITPTIKGRDLVKEQIGELGMSGGEFYAVRRSPSSQISTESNCLDEASTTDAETPETHTASGKQDEAVLEADEVDSPYAAILKDVTGINFRALVDQWNKNGLMETDIDAVSNRIPTGLGTTPTPTSSISISLSDSSRTEAETSDIQTAAVYTRLRSTPTPTSSVSISLGEASTTEAGTSEIHTAAALCARPLTRKQEHLQGLQIVTLWTAFPVPSFHKPLQALLREIERVQLLQVAGEKLVQKQAS
nr:unnamed protein product [Spirometra erinaceieuropaei]